MVRKLIHNSQFFLHSMADSNKLSANCKKGCTTTWPCYESFVAEFRQDSYPLAFDMIELFGK